MDVETWEVSPNARESSEGIDVETWEHLPNAVGNMDGETCEKFPENLPIGNAVESTDTSEKTNDTTSPSSTMSTDNFLNGLCAHQTVPSMTVYNGKTGEELYEGEDLCLKVEIEDRVEALKLKVEMEEQAEALKRERAHTAELEQEMKRLQQERSKDAALRAALEEQNKVLRQDLQKTLSNKVLDKKDDGILKIRSELNQAQQRQEQQRQGQQEAQEQQARPKRGSAGKVVWTPRGGQWCPMTQAPPQQDNADKQLAQRISGYLGNHQNNTTTMETPRPKVGARANTLAPPRGGVRMSTSPPRCVVRMSTSPPPQQAATKRSYTPSKAIYPKATHHQSNLHSHHSLKQLPPPSMVRVGSSKCPLQPVLSTRTTLTRNTTPMVRRT